MKRLENGDIEVGGKVWKRYKHPHGAHDGNHYRRGIWSLWERYTQFSYNGYFLTNMVTNDFYRGTTPELCVAEVLRLVIHASSL